MAASFSSAGVTDDDHAFRKQFMTQLNQTLANMEVTSAQEQPVVIRSMIQEFARYHLGTRFAVPVASAAQGQSSVAVGHVAPVAAIGSPEPPSASSADLASQLTIEQLATLIAEQQQEEVLDEDADNQ
jgi:hypothetical protein